ncbi:hypothetical protein [Bacillus mycoides]|uniref:hypothetical protein n=1 Tax=Bacillus mycoides TaxID=1405 RepID=UPI0025A068E8|nr:hypothetical protein [Bacillus mycoides]MDM5430871.1 hypothetical protein [Bacillus mycoides]
MFEKFIEENISRTEMFIKIPAFEIYQRYIEFCEFNKLVPIKKREFNKLMVMSGFNKTRGNGNKLVFAGVYLKKCKYF